MARTTKSENKTVVEKAPKVLSDKKQTELDHLQGKHTVSMEQRSTGMTAKVSLDNPECGFCKRGTTRSIKKASKTKAFFAGQKK